jgi:hypothetical protein
MAFGKALLLAVPEPVVEERILAALGLALALLSAGCGDGLRAVGEAPFRCADQAWQVARVNPQRFIAHAGGEIDGHRYTNSREAMDRSYRNGLRLLEIDLIRTSDGRLVGAHDWDRWREETGSTSFHPSHREFKETLLFGKYHTLDLANLDRWFAERPDAFLVTDKVADFETLLDGFSHRSRLIVEVFSIGDYLRAMARGVEHPMLSLAPAVAKDGLDAVVDFLASHPVKFVAIATKRVKRFEALLAKLRRNEACVYAFTSSDAAFLEQHFDRFIYGAYTDGWNVHTGGCEGADCARR